MAETTQDLTELAPRLLRSTPFMLVVFCFLLPFFSVSSCGVTETDATGFQIVAGSQLIREQVKPVRPDAKAQPIADAARPWVTLTLIVVAVGGYLVAAMVPRWRGIRAIAAGLALCTWVGAAIAAGSAAPKSLRGDYNPEVGFWLPLLILIVTCVYGVWASARAHDVRVEAGASLGSPMPGDRDRS